jgi:homogentisate 1,2-dioxygenase
MAFMFESCYMVGVTDWGLSKCSKLQDKYAEESWGSLQDHFQPPTTMTNGGENGAH